MADKIENTFKLFVCTFNFSLSIFKEGKSWLLYLNKNANISKLHELRAFLVETGLVQEKTNSSLSWILFLSSLRLYGMEKSLCRLFKKETSNRYYIYSKYYFILLNATLSCKLSVFSIQNIRISNFREEIYTLINKSFKLCTLQNVGRNRIIYVAKSSG